MLSSLANHVPKLKYFVDSNSTTILTAAGVVGTVGTAVLVGRATFKAAEVIAKEQEELEAELKFPETEAKLLSKTEKFKLVWHHYIPPAAVGVTTITCIVMAHKISSRKIAALAIAGGISERALQEYKDKIVEKLGDKKEREIATDVAQDRVNATPPSSREVMMVGSGQVLCYDVTTGRYFQSTIEDIKKAENRVNYELIHYDSCSLSLFYDEIGLPPTPYTDSVGWNVLNHMEVKFSTVLSEDQRPCVAIDFSRAPMSDYDKSWT